ncbi:MAG: 30S ribosomal protein S16 [Planctomycetaceae bacterium]|nr:30S ribosomal protein S16 [Planctomycetaceae bacterium]
MAVRLRMKKMGRRHRPFFRVVAVDGHAPRDGKVIEYLGHYDPLVTETDARVVLKNEKIDKWLSVGAQPSDKVGVLIKKYGTNGTHLVQQKEALERLAASKPTAPPPMVIPKPKVEEPAAEEAAAEEGAVAEAEAPETAEAPAEETAAVEEATSEETTAEEPVSEEAATEGEAKETSD